LSRYDVLIIGAGAAGLMAAARAGARGKKVLLIDHAEKIGEKIRISGGGRCNFTNLETHPSRFISNNPHFCKSALARFSTRDFVALVEKYGIAYHEKDRGQLFCDESATQIVDMLRQECQNNEVTFSFGTTIHSVEKTGDVFVCQTSKGLFESPALIVATGGLSIPKIGATPFGYNLARQFGLNVIPPRPALVPLTFSDKILTLAQTISGVSVDPVIVRCEKISFEEALLFTHRGLSGPAILQISSFWREGMPIHINLLPRMDVLSVLKTARKDHPKKMLRTVLEGLLPSRLAEALAAFSGHDGQMANLSDTKLKDVAGLLSDWTVLPAGTEGYRTAEVTAGGVDTDELSSKTMESQNVLGLYFIGEVVDVTGHLGGYNFQWAWSSAVACADSL